MRFEAEIADFARVGAEHDRGPHRVFEDRCWFELGLQHLTVSQVAEVIEKTLCGVAVQVGVELAKQGVASADAVGSGRGTRLYTGHTPQGSGRAACIDPVDADIEGFAGFAGIGFIDGAAEAESVDVGRCQNGFEVISGGVVSQCVTPLDLLGPKVVLVKVGTDELLWGKARTLRLEAAGAGKRRIEVA